MATTQLKLGSFAFSVDTATFSEIQRSTEYRWRPQERVGQRDALQYVGEGADTITLPGVIFPHYRGGLGQVTELRRQAAAGVPLLLVDGLGGIHGRWVIERVDEQQGVFLPGGVPRRQTYSLQLRKYDDG